MPQLRPVHASSIPHGTVSRTARYPTRHGTLHGTVSHTARYPTQDRGTRCLASRRMRPAPLRTSRSLGTAQDECSGKDCPSCRQAWRRPPPRRCLTFVTPTLLAGDRSLADVVAHEIAHSWSGNLVRASQPSCRSAAPAETSAPIDGIFLRSDSRLFGATDAGGETQGSATAAGTAAGGRRTSSGCASACVCLMPVAHGR